MINNKKGMQIAINTVVGLILGALMFMAGFALLGNIVQKTGNVHDQITDQMEQDIIDAFSSNVPIYIHKNPLSPIKKSDDVIFGIGIHNIFNGTRDFKVEIAYSGNDYSLFNTDEVQVAVSPDSFNLDARNKEVVFVIVPINNLPPGQSVLILNVSSYMNEEDGYVQYDTPKLLYINK